MRSGVPCSTMSVASKRVSHGACMFKGSTEERIKFYWEKRRPLEEEYSQKAVKAEAETTRITDETLAAVRKLSEVSAQVNSSNSEFIRFFIENKEELPSDMKDYVEAWIKENARLFIEAGIKKDALKTKVQQRENSIKWYMEIISDTRRTMMELDDVLHGFTIKSWNVASKR